MNEVFEVMKFGAGSDAGEWEQERGGGRGGGGRGPGRGGGGGGRGMPGRGTGMRTGRGRTWPRYYPITGGGPLWSYPVPYPTPYPTPYPEPDPYPDGPGRGAQEPGADDGMEGELPPQFKAVIQKLGLPEYKSVGTLDKAIRKLPNRLAGLYLIVFRGKNGRERAYHGQSADVRQRLLQHKLCATILDVDTGMHRVYAAAVPDGIDKDRRRKLEYAVHDILLRNSKGQLEPGPNRLLTNQKRELEQELLGEAWR
ncbi:hypothetical protein [Massilia consociata]|uniref:GIY-YIG domain-containing protein n=1 Tax=Massilia consociata TaxID=760117 RepID=A0ABV6FK17_9BURK